MQQISVLPFWQICWGKYMWCLERSNGWATLSLGLQHYFSKLMQHKRWKQSHLCWCLFPTWLFRNATEVFAQFPARKPLKKTNAEKVPQNNTTLSSSGGKKSLDAEASLTAGLPATGKNTSRTNHDPWPPRTAAQPHSWEVSFVAPRAGQLA